MELRPFALPAIAFPLPFPNQDRHISHILLDSAGLIFGGKIQIRTSFAEKLLSRILHHVNTPSLFFLPRQQQQHPTSIHPTSAIPIQTPTTTTPKIPISRPQSPQANHTPPLPPPHPPQLSLLYKCNSTPTPQSQIPPSLNTLDIRHSQVPGFSAPTRHSIALRK